MFDSEHEYTKERLTPNFSHLVFYQNVRFCLGGQIVDNFHDIKDDLEKTGKAAGLDHDLDYISIAAQVHQRH